MIGPDPTDAHETVFINRVIRHIATIEETQIEIELEQLRVHVVLNSMNLRVPNQSLLR